MAVWERSQPMRPGGLVDRYLRYCGFKSMYPPILRQDYLSSHLPPDQNEELLVAFAYRYPYRHPVFVQATRMKEDPEVGFWLTRGSIGSAVGAVVPLSEHRKGQTIVLTQEVEGALIVAQTYSNVTS
jgi:hypothetical protein